MLDQDVTIDVGRNGKNRINSLVQSDQEKKCWFVFVSSSIIDSFCLKLYSAEYNGSAGFKIFYCLNEAKFKASFKQKPMMAN